MKPLAFLAISALFLATFTHCADTNKPPAEQYYTPDDFYKVKKYDVHAHVRTKAPWFVEQAIRDNFYLHTMNVDVEDYPPLPVQQEMALYQVHHFPDRVAYATAIGAEGWNEPGWQAKTLAYLKNSFDSGAVSVKIWKNFGMVLRDKDSSFVMADNPKLDTIYDFIAKNHITLVGHLGEPKNCWLPVDQMTVANDRNYFKNHPQYHMYLHPEYPSYQAQIDARDHMLEKHPDLTFIGAHLASLEWDVDEMAKRLDRFPNMAVETAARMTHLKHQAVTNAKKVRDFFIKYQDRVLYGTDSEADDESDTASVMRYTHQQRLNDWQFFTSADTMQDEDVTGKFTGLHLPREVVNKIYYENARKWIPGLQKMPNGSAAAK